MNVAWVISRNGVGNLWFSLQYRQHEITDIYASQHVITMTPDDSYCAGECNRSLHGFWLELSLFLDEFICHQ